MNDSFFLENKIIFKNYKPLKKIGQGSFSKVYSVLSLKDKEIYALKSEKKNSEIKLLKSEAFNLFNLKGFGIPKFITFGYNKNYAILIEELLGKSLHNIFIENGKKCNLIDFCQIGIQLLDRLEWIHSKNYLYIDIKPENILIGKKEPNVIYFVDFGFCKKYRSSKTGKHILPKITGQLNGALRYASPHSLKGKEASRRDDLIALGYMLIYLYKKTLPWDFDMPHVDYNIINKIKYLKENNGGGSLFKNLPKEMVDYIKYTRNLKFDQNPNYLYLRSLFVKILAHNNYDFRFLTFSWIHPENKIFSGIPKNNNLWKNTPQKLPPRKNKFKNIFNEEQKLKRDISHKNFGHSNEYFNIPSKNIELSFINNDEMIKDINTYQLKKNIMNKTNSEFSAIKQKRNNNNNVKTIKIAYNMNNQNYNCRNYPGINAYTNKFPNKTEDNTIYIKKEALTNNNFINNKNNKKININHCFSKKIIDKINLDEEGILNITTNNFLIDNNVALKNKNNQLLTKPNDNSILMGLQMKKNNNFERMKNKYIDLNYLNSKYNEKHIQINNTPINNKINNIYPSNIILIKNKNKNLKNNIYKSKSPSPPNNIIQKKNNTKNIIYRHNYLDNNIERRYISPSPKLRLNSKRKELNEYFITNNYNICQNYKK